MRKALLILLSCVVCDAQSIITTIAGREVQFEGNGKPGAVTRIGSPRGVVVDNKGNVFFSDAGFSLVLKLDVEGRLSVVANSEQVSSPRGIAVDPAGNVYVSDAEVITQTRPDGTSFAARFGRVRKIAVDGAVSTIAGTGADF